MNKKRYQIPLSDDTAAVYQELADLTDNTFPTAVSSILDSGVPGVQKMNEALRAIRESKQSVFEAMGDVLEQMQKDLDQHRIK